MDCSPKNLEELDNLDKSEECDSVSAKEKTADEIDEMQLEAIGEDEKQEEEGAEEEEVVKDGENENVELESELESVKETEEEEVEDIEKSPQKKETEDIEETIQEKEVEDIEESVQEEEIEEVDALPEAEEENISKTPANLNTSKDDVFEDALDNISSSDEFEAFGSQDSKKVEPSKKPDPEEKPSVADDLEEISSDDDITPKVDKVEKPARTEKLADEGVIDLDSSNECVVCESPTEDKESKSVAEDKKSEDATEDKESKEVTESKESKDVTESKESEAVTEDKEEVAKVDTVEKETETCSVDKEAEAATKDPEEVAEKVHTEEVKEVTVEDSAAAAKEEPLEADKDTENIEGVQEADPKSTEEPKEDDTKSAEEPLETMLVDDEEPTTDPKEDGKEHKKYRTSTQEMNDTTIDDLLMEVGTDSFEAEEKKQAEEDNDDDEPMVIPENEEEPKVNGVSEKASEGETDKIEKDHVSKEKIIPGKETKDTESDDEVIFFEPIDKTKADDTAAAPAEEKKKPEAPSTETDKDDDVVLVSEDEDDEPSAKTTEKEPVKGSEKVAAPEVASTDSKAKESASGKDLLVDNTDNACDQFDKPKTHDKVKSAATEDGNSNSSSSSLLRPAESDDQPRSKRVRLSADEKINSSPEVEAGSLLKPASEEEEKKLIAKRSHDHVESSPVQEKEEIPNKKLKTDDSDSNSSSGTLHIDLDAKDEPLDVTPALEEKEPKLELKPEPEIKTDVKPLRLEFLKNFRKSFDTLTRDDLEELVLQKVVEAMLVKSEFADIRTQLDKSEATLASYRRKIAEVSKQFLDLDTVHKRVLKDLESKNSHFTAPVRITRAVGLQVGIPFKAMKPTVAVQDQSHAAGSMLAPPSGTPPKASTSPMRSPMRSRPALPGPAAAPATATHPSPSTSTSPSPNLQQQPRSNANFGQQPAAATPGTLPVRRGCLQKVTPQRPNPGNVPPMSQANNLPNMHRLQGSPPSGGITRGMHASKHTGSTTGMASSAVVAAAAAKAAAMRSRNANNASAYMAQKQQQQQQLQQQQQYQT